MIGGGGSDVLMVLRWWNEEVAAEANRVSASDRGIAARERTRSPPRISSFLTNQGDPDRNGGFWTGIVSAYKSDHHAEAA